MLADAVPTQVTHDSIAKTSGIITDRRRDLMQMITYLEEKEIREAAKVTKDQPAWIYSSYGRAGKGGYHHFTDEAAMKAVF